MLFRRLALLLCRMISEVGLPGLTAANKGLHQCAFCLDGVHQIVGRPFVDQLAEGDDAQFLMTSAFGQVGIGYCIKEGERIGAQAHKSSGYVRGCLRRDGRAALRIRIKRWEILLGEQIAHTQGKDHALGVDQVLQTFQRGLFARTWR